MAPMGAAARSTRPQGPRRPQRWRPTNRARSRPRRRTTRRSRQRRRPRPKRRRAPEPMAKGRVPTRDELLAFIKESATPVGKREIARAWGLKGDQRIELKQLLRDLRDSGDVAPDRAKTFRDPEALANVAVLEIVRVDNEGHLIAVPHRHDEKKDGLPP